MAGLVAAVSMCKDESDIVEAVLRRMAKHVDLLIVADNSSTDGTRDLLRALQAEMPLLVIDDDDPAYYQSRKVSALAERARREGASWVIAHDLDEVWLPTTPRARIADVLAGLPPDVLVAEAPLFDHVATGHDPAVGDPVARMAWRRAEQAPLRKVACRALPGLTIHQGNHGASFEGVRHPPAVTNALEVRHFAYRSVEQFIGKVRNGAAAYAATDLPDSAGGHWRGYGRILAEQGEAALAEVFHEWFWREEPDQPLTIHGEQQPPLIHDPCP